MFLLVDIKKLELLFLSYFLSKISSWYANVF